MAFQKVVPKGEARSGSTFRAGSKNDMEDIKIRNKEAVNSPEYKAWQEHVQEFYNDGRCVDGVRLCPKGCSRKLDSCTLKFAKIFKMMNDLNKPLDFFYSKETNKEELKRFVKAFEDCKTDEFGNILEEDFLRVVKELSNGK